MAPNRLSPMREISSNVNFHEDRTGAPKDDDLTADARRVSSAGSAHTRARTESVARTEFSRQGRNPGRPSRTSDPPVLTTSSKF